MEIWKEIVGYEKLYQVSNLGRVKSLADYKLKGRYFQFCEEKIMSLSKDSDGYLILTLSKDRIRKQFKVHRLVAFAFIPNPENKPQVNHIDGNKLNNNDCNLEWNTSKENVIHSYLLGLSKGRKGESHHNSKLKNKDILDIRNSNKTRLELSKIYNISISQIRRVILKERW